MITDTRFNFSVKGNVRCFLFMVFFFFRDIRFYCMEVSSMSVGRTFRRFPQLVNSCEGQNINEKERNKGVDKYTFI